MSPDDLHALRFLAELQRLADPTQPAGLRITVRSADGDYIGDAILPTPGAQHAVQAVSAMADFHDRDRDLFNAGTTIDGLDPRALADLEDHFADVDPDSYLTDVFSSADAEASLAAFEQLVTGEWTGEL
ncbi:hypothetical protein E6R18_25195 [Streptomyces sp. A1277]|uniref:hypothetical protein n=1 Tax=Streptomyces sp. A1277 TaxID=2563103 RepID=UPI0010A2385F|nr:hypothetical protein [Streptomyces sp. A1277]THA29208.1 hypothetical protein E6R18_25195 [Streptomyces sp. A1277]